MVAKVSNPLTPHIPAPATLSVAETEEFLRTVSGHIATNRSSLIERAGVRSAVSGVEETRIYLIPGNRHLRLSNGDLAIGMARAESLGMSDEQRARYALEVLAHGFHDYAVRECVRRFIRFVPTDVDGV
jgi:hypothetical protein